jgi:hypothetical protein
MLEIFITIALTLGGHQEGRMLIMSKQVLTATEESMGVHLSDIPGQAVVNRSDNHMVIEIIGTDQNGGGHH